LKRIRSMFIYFPTGPTGTSLLYMTSVQLCLHQWCQECRTDYHIRRRRAACSDSVFVGWRCKGCGRFVTTVSIARWQCDTLSCRDSAVGIATGYGLDDRRGGVRVQVGSKIIFSPHGSDRLWGSPSLLSNGTVDSFPGRKAAGAWSWPLTSNWCRGQANLDLYIHSPHTSSWRNA
jgi:hypothetical protein